MKSVLTYQHMNVLQVSELFKKLAGHFLLPVLVMYIRLTVQAPEDHYHNIVLTGVLRCPMLFTNLFSASCLRKRGWYLHGATKTPNRCDDFQLAFTPIQNGLCPADVTHNSHRCSYPDILGSFGSHFAEEYERTAYRFSTWASICYFVSQVVHAPLPNGLVLEKDGQEASTSVCSVGRVIITLNANVNYFKTTQF